MNVHQAVKTVKRLRKGEIAKNNFHFIVNHFAHCAKMLHKDLEQFFLPFGIEPAWDGMKLFLGHSS